MKRSWMIVAPIVGLAFAVAVVVVPNFIRARNTPASNACINNLRQMDGAMQCWRLENRERSGDEFLIADITPYLKPAVHCPQGGKYTVGPVVSNGVTCSFPGHTLSP